MLWIVICEGMGCALLMVVLFSLCRAASIADRRVEMYYLRQEMGQKGNKPFS